MLNKQKYVEKPAEIEAVLFEGGAPNGPEIVSWVVENNGAAIWYGEEAGRPERLDVFNNGGVTNAYPGDYVVKERDGSFSVFNPEELFSDWTPLS